MDETENYQFNYQKLLRFLTREGGGYTFVLVDDARYIRQVNESLKADLESKQNIKVGIVFLDEKSDEPVPHQLTVAAEIYDVLLVANMYEIARDTKDGHAAITALNFNRETIQGLPCKIVFWVQEKSLAFVANFAADLYVQRAFSTIHFTGVMESIVPEMPHSKDWEYYLSSENFKEIEARIATFKRRLKDAEEAEYPRKRIADEIVLPLAKDYAELGMKEKAEKLLETYLPLINQKGISTLEKLGEIYHKLHQLNKSIAYQEVVLNEINNKLTNESSSPVTKAEAAFAVNRLGDLYMETGDLFKAESYFQNYFRIIHDLYSAYPQIEALKTTCAIAYSKLGDVNKEQGRFAEAFEYFSKDLALTQELYSSKPQSESVKTNLTISYSKLGEISRVQGRFAEALEYFNKALELTQELYLSNPRSELHKTGLAICYKNLGEINQAEGRFTRALEYFSKTLALAEELYSSNPQSESHKNNLAISYENLGDINQSQGRLLLALDYFTKDLKLTEELYSSNPQSVNLYHGLAISYWKIGNLKKMMRNKKEARYWFEKAEKIYVELSEKVGKELIYKKYLTHLRNDLLQLQSS